MAEVTKLLNNPFEKAQLEAELKGELELSLRFNIEGQIVRKLIEDAISQNYVIEVNDGEEDVYKGRDVALALAACFSTDEDYLLIYPQHPGTGRIGWVRLIYGNSGWDVMNDWLDTDTCNHWVKGASELADRLEKGHVTVEAHDLSELGTELDAADAARVA